MEPSTLHSQKRAWQQAQTGRFPVPDPSTGGHPPAHTGRFADMTQQNPNYHYNKARECLRRAESKDEGYTKDLQMAEAHMGIYRTLMEEMRKNQELWNRMPYRSSPTPWMTTYGTTTNADAGLDQS